MEFLDPTIDFAFKRLFANQSKKTILISFINNILMREGDNLVVDVVVTDPQNHPSTDFYKMSTVDVRCTDQSGKQYIVELQVKKEQDFSERSQYYAAVTLANQLGKSMAYKKLEPVYFIGVLDFKLFPSLSNYLTTHKVLDSVEHRQHLRHLEWYFIELPKFNKKLDEIASIADLWIYLLKYAKQFDQIPEPFEKNDALKEALEELNYGTLSIEEQAAYHQRVDFWRSELNALETAYDDGNQKGRKEGAYEKSCAIAVQLLTTGMTIQQIAAITELSEATIVELQKK